jgi:hypothetical protein
MKRMSVAPNFRLRYTVRERSSSVSRTTADRRRLLNRTGTTKLEKFPQTDRQTDKARRQVYVRDVNVADPAVPSIH